jgi:hypothetical protein
MNPRPGLDALDRLMRQSGGMPPAPVPTPLHRMAAMGAQTAAVVIPFPYVPSPERLAEIFALSDEIWEQREAEELREANAGHAGRLTPRLTVVRD